MQRHSSARAGTRPACRKLRSGVLAALAALAVLATLAPVALAIPADTQPPLKTMQVDLNDTAALRMGALYVMRQCTACHSLQGARFAELAAPLELTRSQLESTLKPADVGIFDTITSAMPPDVAKVFFNTEPPDLTVISRRRDAGWLYTYLTSFYVDPDRFTGANNVVFHNVAMPNVFASLQGLQKPVEVAGYRDGARAQVAMGVAPLTDGTMTPAQFDRMAREIVSFLYLVGHPHEQESHAIGTWVLTIFAFMSVLMYLIYRLYWRRVKRAPGGRWWHYWRP